MICRQIQRPWLPVLLCAITFGLRLADLINRGFWLDESFTLLRIYGSWADILRNFVARQNTPTTDVLPMVYFLLLKAWMLFSGQSPFALKLFSVFASMLAVPVTWVASRRFFSRASAPLAALFACLCASYQWYGWELRMYTLMVPLAIIQLYLAARMLERFTWPTLLLWFLVAAASLATHYSFASWVLAQALVLVGSFIWKVLLPRVANRKLQVGFALLVISLVAMGILFGPRIADTGRRIYAALPVVKLGTPTPPVPLLPMVMDVLNNTVFGPNATDPSNGIILTGFGVLVLVGLVAMSHGHHAPEQRGLIFACLLVPLVFWSLVPTLIPNRPSYRYLIFLTPLVHLTIANSIVWLGTRAGRLPTGLVRLVVATVFVLVFGLQSFGLAQAYVHGPPWQDDWRSFANHIRSNWANGDVLMLNINTPEAILHDMLGDMPIEFVYAFDQIRLYDDARWTDQFAAKYRRIWYANTGGDASEQNPQIQRALARFPRIQRVDFGGRTTQVQLDLFQLERVDADKLPADAIAIPGLLAKGYRLTPGSPFGETPITTLSLWLRLPEDVRTHTLAVDARLSDTGNNLWMTWFVADATKGIVVNPRCRGEVICRVDIPLAMPAGLASQPYVLGIRLVEPAADVQRDALSLELGADEVLRCIRVGKFNSVKPIARLGALELAAVETPVSRRPGESVPMNLVWRPVAHVPSGFTIRVSLLSQFGIPVLSVTKTAGSPLAPATAWNPGELVREQVQVATPKTLRPGAYSVSIQVVGPGERTPAVVVGHVTINDFVRKGPAGTTAFPNSDQVGGLTFLGYDPPDRFQRGARTEFVSSWRVDTPPTVDGVLFMHIIGPDGKPAGQDDLQPEQNTRSLQTYQAGEGFVIQHRITLAADAPAGRYRVIVGAYNAVDGTRFPASAKGSALTDDLIEAGEFVLP